MAQDLGGNAFLRAAWIRRSNLLTAAMLFSRGLVSPPQEEQPQFQQITVDTVMEGVKANAKGLGWPLIAEVPTEGWPLLVDMCFQFLELATL